MGMYPDIRHKPVGDAVLSNRAKNMAYDCQSSPKS